MEYEGVDFSRHALSRMFERAITPEEVLSVLNFGEVIADYPDDQPFPSEILLAFVKGRPLHVVAAYDDVTRKHYVITAYCPNPAVWSADFRRRR